MWLHEASEHSDQSGERHTTCPMWIFFSLIPMAWAYKIFLHTDMDMVEKLGKEFRDLPTHVGTKPVDHVFVALAAGRDDRRRGTFLVPNQCGDAKSDFFSQSPPLKFRPIRTLKATPPPRGLHLYPLLQQHRMAVGKRARESTLWQSRKVLLCCALISLCNGQYGKNCFDAPSDGRI